MRITIGAGYIKGFGRLAFMPESTAEWAQFRELLANAKKYNVKHYLIDNDIEGRGIGFHIPLNEDNNPRQPACNQVKPKDGEERPRDNSEDLQRQPIRFPSFNTERWEYVGDSNLLPRQAA